MSDIERFLPPKLKDAPIGDYYIGADYCDKNKELNLAIFCKTDNVFHYLSKKTVVDKDKAMHFAQLVSQYLNGTLLYEVNH